MFLHLIPLAELKRHSATYWLPGRDHGVSTDTWVVLREVDSGYVTSFFDFPAGTAHLTAEDVLELFLRDASRAQQRQALT